MFLFYLARPRYDSHGKRYVDGKLGICALVEYKREQRNAKHISAGRIEMKLLNVTREVYTNYLVEKDFPAIRN